MSAAVAAATYAVWDPESLRSPHGGTPLRACGDAHSLTDGARRYPVIEGIPFLRRDREELADAALAALDGGDAAGALALLLGDRDDWAITPPPQPEALRALARDGAANFRAALDALAFGPTAAYLTHRWSDPTFVAGLGLLRAHPPSDGARTFEVACGTAPYVRELARCGFGAAGGDVAFSKLWLARRFVAPAARLVCFDAAAPWPFADGAFDYVHCHDAFYFLPRKDVAAKEMRRAAGRDGTLAVSHAHNAAVDNFSAGAPLDAPGYAALFPNAVPYDDRELADALVGARLPYAATPRELDAAEAFAFVCGPVDGSVAYGPEIAYETRAAYEKRRPLEALALPAAGAALVRNPLYVESGARRARVRWPSERYEREYATLATYPLETCAPARARMGESERVAAWARSRELVALPERW